MNNKLTALEIGYLLALIDKDIDTYTKTIKSMDYLSNEAALQANDQIAYKESILKKVRAL